MEVKLKAEVAEDEVSTSLEGNEVMTNDIGNSGVKKFGNPSCLQGLFWQEHL